MARIKECFLDVFTVYLPDGEGVPRKYLVREDSISIFDHNSVKEIPDISQDEKEAIWFSMINLLGEAYIRQKLDKRPPPVAKKEPSRNLELSSGFYVIDGETRDVNLDMARSIIRNLSSFSSEKSALQTIVDKVSDHYDNRSWTLKSLSVGLFFGTPRLVITDMKNIYVLSGGKIQDKKVQENSKIQDLIEHEEEERANKIQDFYRNTEKIIKKETDRERKKMNESQTDYAQRPKISIEKTTLSGTFTTSFMITLQTDLRHSPVEQALQSTVHKLPPDYHWEIKFYTPVFEKSKPHIIFQINGAKYLLTQEELREPSEPPEEIPVVLIRHAGLPNMGNASYQTSVLQCLAHSNSMHSFLDDHYTEQSEITLGGLFKELIKLIRIGNSEDAASNLIEIRYLLEDRWKNGTPQDPQEFLESFLKNIDREVPVASLFQGNKSIVSNFLCGVHLERVEDFGFVSVIDKRKLQELMNKMNSEKYKEKLQCPTHSRVETCYRYLSINTFPQVLVFSYSTKGYEINLRRDENLAIGEIKYRLMSVLFVRKTEEKAVCRAEDSWYLFEDSNVNEISELTIKHPVLAFYDKLS